MTTLGSNKEKDKSYNFLANFLLNISVFCLLFVASLISLQVVLRNFFTLSIPDSIIIFENFAIIVILFPLVSIRNKQIRVSFFYRKITFKKWVHHLSYVFSLFVSFVFLFSSWQSFWHSLQTNSYHEGFLEIPKYPIQFLLFFSILVFSFTLLQDLYKKIKEI